MISKFINRETELKHLEENGKMHLH